MDPKLRSMIGIFSVILYIAMSFMFYEIIMVRIAGILIIAAVQIAISLIVIFTNKNTHAQRMEISMIIMCLAAAVYVLYKMLTF